MVRAERRSAATTMMTTTVIDATRTADTMTIGGVVKTAAIDITD